MQGRYWLLTIPGHCFVPYQPPGISKIKGQLEEGEGGFTHWQILAVFERGVRLAAVRKCFGPYHAEPFRFLVFPPLLLALPFLFAIPL